MDVQLLEPMALLCLLALPLVWFVPRRLDHVGHGFLRVGVFGALIVALARPIVFVADDTEHHVFVVDRSPSVAAFQHDLVEVAIDRSLRSLPPGSRAVRVELGAAGSGDERFARSLVVDVGGASLPRALVSADRQIPADARGAILVFSDGASADTEWGPACQALTSRGIPVSVVPLRSRDDVYPVSIHAPAPLRVGATAQLDVEVVGVGAITAELAGPDGPLADAQRIESDGRARFRFEFEPEHAGFLPVRVTTTCAADTHHDNDVRASELAVQEPLNVLYLGQRLQGGDAQLTSLLGAGFAVETRDRIDDAGLPLAQCDLLVVDDYPATDLVQPVQRQIVDAVRDDGLGVLFAGGRAAFGPGGYHDSVLAEAMPVEFVQKEEKRDPSTTLVLIIDTSGSMGGMRVTLAKEVSRLAMKRLLPHDKVGIVEFYGAKRWAAPIQPASNLIELQRAINRLDSGGGTVILPAIEEAFYGLQNVETRYKHVLILTDGGVESGAFEPLLRKMADRGINTSTVLVGPEAHSEFLVSLANWGKGRFYNVPNRFSIPELILKQPASAQLPAYRPGQHAVAARGGRGWWGGVDTSTIPALLGYVETRAKPGALTILETRNNRSPVLASWRHGLGRATAITTEIAGPGTANWAEWADYGTWLGRVCARTARDSREPFAYAASRRGVEVIVRASRRVDGDALPRVRVVDAAGRAGTDLSLRRLSRDVFEARQVVDPEVAIRVIGGEATRCVAPARDLRTAELQVDPVRVLPLTRLAAATAGTSLDLATVGTERLAVGGPVAPAAVVTLWPWLLLSCLLLYLSELLMRRWPTYVQR